jgi:glutamate formiminotransferase
MTAASLLNESLAKIDLTKHEASHPRLGVVDHMSFHPLENCSLDELGRFVENFGEQVAKDSSLPVLLYGYAHQDHKQLAEVRRGAGYFKDGLAINATVHADFGPTDVDPRVGVVCLGVVPFLLNFNVRLTTSDLSVGRTIAKGVRERNGGLAKVEALALQHKEGAVEVACNLLDTAISPPEAVLQRITELATEQDIGVHSSYAIGLTEPEVLAKARFAAGLPGL